MQKKESKLLKLRMKRIQERKLQAKKKLKRESESQSSSFSTDTSVKNDNYMNMNGNGRDSIGKSQRSSYGRPSRVRMKGGKLTEYLTKIRLSKQLSLTDIGNDSMYGSLALKKSVSSESNDRLSSGNSPLKLRKKKTSDYEI